MASQIEDKVINDCTDCSNGNNHNDQLLVTKGSPRNLTQQRIEKGTSTFQLDSLLEDDHSDSVEISVSSHDGTYTSKSTLEICSTLYGRPKYSIGGNVGLTCTVLIF